MSAAPEVPAGCFVPAEEAVVELSSVLDLVLAEDVLGVIADAYTERCRSLSADAKIKFIRYDYEYDVQLRKDF